MKLYSSFFGRSISIRTNPNIVPAILRLIASNETACA
jgi:hypothetical protein